MRILIAAPDRDLLACYKKLLEMAGNKVDTVFDGTQVVSSVANARPDIVILDNAIPRLDSRKLIKLLNDECIPAIVLINHRIDLKTLLDNSLANSYLSYPFLPDELSSRINAVMSKANFGKTVNYGGVTADTAKFIIGNIRVTNEELDLLDCASDGSEIELKHTSTYVSALNNKLQSMGNNSRIKYITNEGYRLVTDNE